MSDEKMDRPSLRLLIGRENLVGAEIGVYKGVNAKEILTYLDIKKLYLIDNWSRKYGMGKEECEIHLSNWLDIIVFLHGRSEVVASKIKDDELDFVYIDGGHTESQVAMDLKLYYPKVKKGGLICGHDYQGGKPRGVNKAVDKFFGKGTVYSGECARSKRHMDWWVWK
jgi:predicted O-methyltransferase YrrM